MASNTTHAQSVNSIQVAEKTRHEGRGIIVCVDFEHEPDADDANQVAEDVARALVYEENARKAADIADKYSNERLHPFIKSLSAACRKNFKEIEDANLYGSTMAVASAVIIADYHDKLAQAQQRNDTLEMMLNHQDAQAKA